MTLFEKVIREEIFCDICGELMLPVYGSGWDNDRLVCTDRFRCGAEVIFPSSTRDVELDYLKQDKYNER
jgi:hypothetical protein